MQNSVQDPQDPIKTSSMEDSNGMTVEFLRARLLSERSVSKSARQRADELAKKVMELEEQLRVVTLQRKMAEKATVDVLSILESQGISDVSDEFDFSSDLETPCDSGLSNDSASAKGEKRSNVDSSPAPGRSLSWKGRLDSSHSLEKYNTSNVRRRSSFPSISSSPKHRLGKSCRRLKHRETRLVVEESRDPPVNLDCQGNEAVSSYEGFPNGSNDGPNILRRECKIQENDESALANISHDVDGQRENNMERALEHQARLIDRYEAMEKAQREWEDKFRENNSSTPESCDMWNNSDVTEERDEGKAQALWSATEATSGGQEGEPKEVYFSEEMLKVKPGDNMPKLSNDTGDNNQNGKTVGTSGFHGQENSPSLMKGNTERIQVNCHSQPPEQHHDSPCRHESPDSKPTNSSPTDVYGVLPLKEAPSNKNSLNELVPPEQSHEISGVLESLKQAKLSLQKKINKLPLVESGYSGKAIQTAPLLVSKSEGSGIPVGFSGLFRLPTNFSDEATARFNYRDSTSGFISNVYPGRGIARISNGHVGTNPYAGTMLTSAADDHAFATRCSEAGPRFDTKRSPSDLSDESSSRFNFPDSTRGFSPNNYSGRGISGTSGGQFSTNPYSGIMLSPSSDHQSLSIGYMETGSRFDTKRAPFAPFYHSSGKYLVPPTFPISPSYQNATPPPMSFGERPTTPHSSSTIGVPPAYHFPYHSDHTK